MAETAPLLEGRAGGSTRRNPLLFRLALGSVLLAAALVTLVTLSANRGPSELLVDTQQQGLADVPDTLTAPTHEDMSSFLPIAKDILKSIGIDYADVPKSTDLEEGCGQLLLPCLATVGKCVQQRITTAGDKHISNNPRACQCFVRGLVKSLKIPEKPEMQVGCSFQCLESIRGAFESHMEASNGLYGEDMHCNTVFSDMATQLYGTRNDDINTEADVDALHLESLSDPKVLSAADALQMHINTYRYQHCPAKTLYTTPPQIIYATQGIASEGRSQYRMEMIAGGTDSYFGRVAHLPLDEQTWDPSLGEMDPSDLEGRYMVVIVKPDPCGSGHAAQLAVTEASVRAINNQGLSWTAGLGKHEGRTVDSFGTGFKPLSDEIRVKHTKLLNTNGFNPPEAFDARDRPSVTDPKCMAFDVLDQGSCGSCYAFAAATSYSARLCKASAMSWNAVMSAQEMMDCTNGCDGGNSLDVFKGMVKSPTVADWCDPYQQKKDVCGKVCSNGVHFRPLDDTMHVVGGFNDYSSPSVKQDAVKQMQLELVQDGPGVVGFQLFDDFYAYTGGVYQKSATAKAVGWHAAALLGWGTEKGVDYWLVQNSWSARAGDGGFWKIRRGTDECSIEKFGLTVTKPQIPAMCANVKCENGAEMQKDCSCKCTGGWRGAQCGVCGLTCKNGGTVLGRCEGCSCPMGSKGDLCEGLYTLDKTATCTDKKDELIVRYTLTQADAPTQKSFMGIFEQSEKDSSKGLSQEYICGTYYNQYSRKGLCYSQGYVKFNSLPTTPGNYKIAIVRWNPANEFGQEGYMKEISDSDVISAFTVLDAGCSPTELKSAESENDAMKAFELKEKKEKVILEEKDKEMLDREKDVIPIQEKLVLDPIPTDPVVHITGVSAMDGILWASGAPNEVCFSIPPAMNTNPKNLLLYVGDGSSGSYYARGLLGGGLSKATPPDGQACMQVTVSTGLPDGKLYTIKLQDKAWKPFAQTSFVVARAFVQFSYYKAEPNWLDLKVRWTVTRQVADVKDTIKVYNSAGTVVDWFFTSCMCKDLPSSAKTAISGTYSFKLSKANSVQGGYHIKFYPKGTDVAAATDDGWIKWAALGW